MSNAEGCVIVTGGSSGLGLRVVERLCQLGRDVVLACRSKEKGEAAIAIVKAKVSTAIVSVMIVDLADEVSIRSFVKAFRATGKRLAVLINNAGVTRHFGDRVKHVLPNNWEVCMATNHMGHFLLTNLLLDAVRESGVALEGLRIVVVASMIIENKTAGHIDMEDLMYEKPGAYKDGKQAYKNSKAANALFTLELARRLAPSGVRVNCLCPGFIPDTNLFRESGTVLNWIMKNVLNSFVARKLLPVSTLDQGADRVLALAIGSKGDAASGCYFKNGEISEVPPEIADPENQRKLWEVSEKLLALKWSSQ